MVGGHIERRHGEFGRCIHEIYEIAKVKGICYVTTGRIYFKLAINIHLLKKIGIYINRARMSINKELLH